METKKEYEIDGKIWVTAFGAKLLLGKLDGSDIDLSMQTIYSFAQKYHWQSIKIGVTRLYLKSDVIEKTPSRVQRWAKGYGDARALRKT